MTKPKRSGCRRAINSMTSPGASCPPRAGSSALLQALRTKGRLSSPPSMVAAARITTGRSSATNSACVVVEMPVAAGEGHEHGAEAVDGGEQGGEKADDVDERLVRQRRAAPRPWRRSLPGAGCRRDEAIRECARWRASCGAAPILRDVEFAVRACMTLPAADSALKAWATSMSSAMSERQRQHPCSPAGMGR